MCSSVTQTFQVVIGAIICMHTLYAPVMAEPKVKLQCTGLQEPSFIELLSSQIC